MGRDKEERESKKEKKAQKAMRGNGRADALTATRLRPSDILYTYSKVLPYFSCLLYTSPSPRDKRQSRMPSSA